MLKDTEEHLAETMRLGPGYYRIRERYDYAIESDERYIEKLRKQIAEYDQDKLNENQQIVLEWLKSQGKRRPIMTIADFADAYYGLEGAPVVPLEILSSYEQLSDDEVYQLLAAFAEWGKKEVAE
ncbi:Uncharacterised protein [Enterococcus malodoratus]|uniref:hypothetical protein n=1 Tax=Enterococcus malodoratus TaxID=71451 RepID=UPI000D8FC765|nr:hypothetical protein [Enterococcus malodoratus]SPW86803.1 Uncharacterised protein [Enterococcus malodoratus]